MLFLIQWLRVKNNMKDEKMINITPLLLCACVGLFVLVIKAITRQNDKTVAIIVIFDGLCLLGCVLGLIYNDIQSRK